MHEELILSCKKQDHQAQMKIYDLYSESMYKTVVQMVRQPQVAEDLVQESFLKAFTKIESFQNGTPFGAWLKTITINTTLDWLRKKKIKTCEIDFLENIPNHKEGPSEEEKDLFLKVMASLETIEEKYKTVLKLFYLEDYTHKEIATQLNITEMGSRTRLRRGKMKLTELVNINNYAS